MDLATSFLSACPDGTKRNRKKIFCKLSMICDLSGSIIR